MQDQERQVDALFAAGIEPMHIYSVKNSGLTVDRPGLAGVLRFASDGDAIVVHTLDRLGRTVRGTLNMIRDVAETGVVLDTSACLLVARPARCVEHHFNEWIVQSVHRRGPRDEDIPIPRQCTALV